MRKGIIVLGAIGGTAVIAYLTAMYVIWREMGMTSPYRSTTSSDYTTYTTPTDGIDVSGDGSF